MRSHGDTLRSKHATAGMAMAAATFTMGLTSGVQAILYLHSFGIDGRTDGFFVAFAVYTVFGIFSQSIRVTSAPLLVPGKRCFSLRAFAATLGVIAIPVAIATIPLAGPLSMVLAPGLSDADRGVTEAALPLLGGAMILQLWAAGAATVLAVRDRFGRVAMSYTVGAVSSIGVYLAVSGPAGELAIAWSSLSMAVITLGMMLLGLRGVRDESEARTRRLRLGDLIRNAGLILGRTSVYLAFNGLYLVTLAFTTRYEAGDATVLSYAYLFANYLVGGTAFALGTARIADMRRGALADWRAVLADTVPHGFRYSMLLVAPALAALVTCVAPMVGALFGASFSSGDVETLRVFGAVLAAWTVAALLVNLVLPAMFALGRARLVNALALPMLGLHVLATIIGGLLFGAVGVVAAAFVGPLAYGSVLLVVGARSVSGESVSGHLARELTRDGLRLASLAAACFGAGVLLGASVADGIAETIIIGATGTILYAVLVPAVMPEQVGLVIRSLKPASNSRRLASEPLA